MIIIYGTRMAGRVEGVGGEYAATRFAHIYWLPLIPVKSFWVYGPTAEGFRGHATSLHGRSILAAYARPWGIIAAALAFVAGAWLLAIPLLAVSLASFAWWNLRSPPVLRERALWASIAGTHCDPDQIPVEYAADLRARVANDWGSKYTETPGDVARFGPKDEAQAAHAYALLRLSARDASGANAETLKRQAAAVARATGAGVGRIGPGPYRAA